MPSRERMARGPIVVIECVENIPCDPCMAACPKGAISIKGDLNCTPSVDTDICDGCGVCISACPGLAIFSVDMSRGGDAASVSLPYEFLPLPSKGDTVVALDRSGDPVCNAKVVRVMSSRALDRTPIVTLELPREHALSVRHFRRGEQAT
ncbi:MAG: 4Fe-4S binding protein [Candidatus Eisenbacteria bacterium]|nr:4Fe-4S binding protein [Candidatus Eisenbacteria bacterium]